MADFPYLPIWVADFMSDTEHLDCIETGAYLLLLFAAWRSPECALPDDDRKLARLSRCSLKQWGRIKPAVMAFWSLGTDSLWHQKKLDEVRRTVSGRSLKAVQSAQAMWLKRRERESANAERTLSDRYANQNPNKILIHESDRTINTDAARDPALHGGSGPRASRIEPQATLEELAKAARARLLKGET